jgi:hypothetical protein
MASARNLELLGKHLDLLPPVKQPLARWLCEDWANSKKRLPGALRRKYWQLYPFELASSTAPERLLRELVLELLSQHRGLVLRRQRVGANRKTGLGPRRNAG